MSIVLGTGSSGGVTSRWRVSSRESNRTSLWIGRSSSLRFLTWTKRIWTFHIRLSLLGITSVTRPSGHWFLGGSSSWIITISPTLQSRWGVFQFCLVQRKGEKSQRNLNQNWLAMKCTRLNLFLEYRSNRSKLPGGGSIISVFEVSKWFGVMGSGEPGSDKFSTVRGRLSMTFSTSVIRVRKASSSSWLPCSCNSTETTDLTVRMSFSQTPAIWDEAGALKGLGHAILGNFSIDQVVIELTEITK